MGAWLVGLALAIPGIGRDHFVEQQFTDHVAIYIVIVGDVPERPEVRREFPDAIYWNASVVTDALLHRRPQIEASLLVASNCTGLAFGSPTTRAGISTGARGVAARLDAEAVHQRMLLELSSRDQQHEEA